MKTIIKRIVAQLFGIKISKIDTPMRSLELGLEHLAKSVNPHTIIDIGVANGTPELYRAFPYDKHRYLLIEADPAHNKAVDRIAKQMRARVAKVFCGPKEGSIKFHSAQNNAEYSSAYTLKRGVKTSTLDIPMKTLDSLLRDFDDSSYLIKIDVEGAELDVLKGAMNTLKKTVALVIETSVAVKYETGPEFADLICFMREQGFSVYDMLAGANADGRLYQLDAIFVRTDASFR
jgi:FkbM family methyltransferase